MSPKFFPSPVVSQSCSCVSTAAAVSPKQWQKKCLHYSCAYLEHKSLPCSWRSTPHASQVCNNHPDVEKKRKEKTTPFGVSSMRSQVLYRAAQVPRCTGHLQFTNMSPPVHGLLKCVCPPDYSTCPLQATARGHEMQHDHTVATVEIECVKSALKEGKM